MARRAPSGADRTSGFSLVEMMVAMVFVAILMAGMAAVFKASISNFYTSGEKLSSSRRNRMALNLLYTDVESAGMFIGPSLGNPPSGTNPSDPLFYVLPNQTVAGYTVNTKQQYADELWFYFDQAMPFRCHLTAGNTYTDAAAIVSGKAPATEDNGFTVECPNYAYAMQVYNASLASLSMALMDQWDVKPLAPMASAPTLSSLADPNQPFDVKVYTTAGSTGNQTSLWSVSSQAPANTHVFQHNTGANVMFYVPGQMVHYYVKMLNLDPTNPAMIPCLVRDQGNYSATPAGFVSNSEQVITENVSGFKVYLSPNPSYLSANKPAETWAPFNAIGNGKDMTTAWTNGVLADFNTQLAICGRSGLTSTTSPAIMSGNYGNGMAWFRAIPAVVRLDITTQTATQRSEYSSNGQTLANATLTRSLIIIPHNFGLPLD